MSRDMSRGDSWVVLGPGRTGSWVIVAVIQDAYKEQGIRLPLAPNTDPPTRVQPGTIVHTHDVSILDRLDEGTQVVISTRDLHESVCSRIIMDHVGRVHFSSLKPEDVDLHANLEASTEQIYVDPMQYRQWVKAWIHAYEQVQDLPYPYIDYRQFKHDHREIRNRLSLPAIRPNLNPHNTTIPTPRSHRQWITNYDELAALSNILCPFKPWTTIPTQWEARS